MLVITLRFRPRAFDSLSFTTFSSFNVHTRGVRIHSFSRSRAIAATVLLPRAARRGARDQLWPTRSALAGHSRFVGL